MTLETFVKPFVFLVMIILYLLEVSEHVIQEGIHALFHAASLFKSYLHILTSIDAIYCFTILQTMEDS